MEFENNWDFRFASRAFEPKLHLEMVYVGEGGYQASPGDAGFNIYYDPAIVPGSYVGSRSPEAPPQKNLLRFAPPPRNIDLWSVTFNGSQNISTGGYSARRSVEGETLRVKIYAGYAPGVSPRPLEDDLRSLCLRHDLIRKRNIPVISKHVEEFLLYAFKNVISIPALYCDYKSDENYDSYMWPMEDTKRVEICLHETVLTKVFKLSAHDYPEVEAGWHCLEAQELWG